MDKKSLYYDLAKIYTEEKLRQHNNELFETEGCYDNYERNMDLALNYLEEAHNGFEALEKERSASKKTT